MSCFTPSKKPFLTANGDYHRKPQLYASRHQLVRGDKPHWIHLHHISLNSKML